MAGPLSRFLALYAALFAAFGVASPFLPGLLASDGLDPNGIGVVLAAGTAIRLLAGPAGGRLADRSGAPRQVLIGLLIAASVVALGYVPARGLDFGEPTVGARLNRSAAVQSRSASRRCPAYSFSS